MKAKEYTKAFDELKPTVSEIVRQIVNFQLDTAPNKTQLHNIMVIITDAMIASNASLRARLTLTERALEAAGEYILELQYDAFGAPDSPKTISKRNYTAALAALEVTK